MEQISPLLSNTHSRISPEFKGSFRDILICRGSECSGRFRRVVSTAARITSMVCWYGHIAVNVPLVAGDSISTKQFVLAGGVSRVLQTVHIPILILPFSDELSNVRVSYEAFAR